MPRYKQGNPKAFQRGYDSYSRSYDAKASKLESKGGAMKLPKMSEEEWLQTYISYRNDYREQVAKGERKQIGNINQYIISDQAYFMSAKQARNIQKGVLETYTGEDIEEIKRLKKETNITALRSGKFDWKTIKGTLGWQSFLSEQYQEAKKELGSANAAHEYIQDFFFGTSPK